MGKITNKQSIDAWSKVTPEFINKYTEKGDFNRQYLLNPVIFSLLGEVKGKKILDAGSGQGYFARMLAKRGALVTGIEPAENLIVYARDREKKEKLGITHIQEDLSLWKPAPETFDAVVSINVFMDIPDYKPAIKNCIAALKKGGVFVFAILHPCFEEQVDWQKKQSVVTSEYFEEYEQEQKGYFGYLFHRPLNTYINFLIDNGCVINKIVEPQLPDEVAKQFPKQARDAHVPGFLVVKATKR